MTLTELIRQKNIAFGALCDLEREVYCYVRRRRSVPSALAEQRGSKFSRQNGKLGLAILGKVWYT